MATHEEKPKLKLQSTFVSRLTLTRADVGVGVDAALAAMRGYCERAARELHAAGGRILPRDGAAPPSLQQQMEGLQAWHAFLATRLQVFKVCAFPGAVKLGLIGTICVHGCTAPWAL